MMKIRVSALCFAILALAFQNCAKIKVADSQPSQNETVGDISLNPVLEPSSPTAIGDPISKTPTVPRPPVSMSDPKEPISPVAPPVAPKPTGKYVCVHRAGAPTVVEDLFEEWSDGSLSFKEKCSDWHSTVKENRGYNCGAPEGSPINRGFSACCPMGSVTVNGRCKPEIGLGEECFADANCKAGLSCRDDLADQSVNRRRLCQPKI